MEMKIRESCLQTGTFIYKPGILVTKQDFHLQSGSLVLQMGFSGYYLPTADVREARKTCIYVARFTNTGLDFYYGLPLGELNRFTGDAVEVMKEIRRAGKG